MVEETGGDMEFRQAMSKIPAEKKKKVGYTGKQSVIGRYRFKTIYDVT